MGMGRFLRHLIMGAGSILDLTGQASGHSSVRLREIRPDGPQADAEAIRGDFLKVGNDLRKAMLSFDVEARKNALDSRQQPDACAEASGR